MLISDEKRFVFVHVPKTGGSSVSAALRPWCIERQTSRWYSFLRLFDLPRDYRRYRFRTHEPLRTAQRKLSPGVFDGYFKFAFVRNPWDRLVSEYNALMHKPEHRRYARVKRLGSFPAYVRTEGVNLVRTQYELLEDSSGELGVDFVGRFERLAEDFARVCERLGIETGLGRHNAHDHPGYREFYDDATREFVRRHWKKDIEAFGYEF